MKKNDDNKPKNLNAEDLRVADEVKADSEDKKDEKPAKPDFDGDVKDSDVDVDVKSLGAGDVKDPNVKSLEAGDIKDPDVDADAKDPRDPVVPGEVMDPRDPVVSGEVMDLRDPVVSGEIMDPWNPLGSGEIVDPWDPFYEDMDTPAPGEEEDMDPWDPVDEDMDPRDQVEEEDMDSRDRLASGELGEPKAAKKTAESKTAKKDSGKAAEGKSAKKATKTVKRVKDPILPEPLFDEEGNLQAYGGFIDQDKAYPIMPTRSMICFPNSLLSFASLKNPASAKWMYQFLEDSEALMIMLGAQEGVGDFGEEELETSQAGGIKYYKVGCLAVMRFILGVSHNKDAYRPDVDSLLEPGSVSQTSEKENVPYRASIKALARVKVEIIPGEFQDFGKISFLDYDPVSKESLNKIRTMKYNLYSAFQHFLQFNVKDGIRKLKYETALNFKTVDELMDYICASVPFSNTFRQEQLEETDLVKRMRNLIDHLRGMVARSMALNQSMKDDAIPPYDSDDEYHKMLNKILNDDDDDDDDDFGDLDDDEDEEDFESFKNSELKKKIAEAAYRAGMHLNDPLESLQYVGDNPEEIKRFKQKKARIKRIRDSIVNTGSSDYYKKLLVKDISDEGLRVILKEINFVENAQRDSSSEVNSSRIWLDFVTNLPFGNVDEEIYDIKRARNILDKGHYGLERVKERILEYLSVMQLKNENPEGTDASYETQGAIICLTGPPGVGKTSIAKAIAEATGRKFARMSLGGVRDEAEIRGHRKTYVAALPGRIMNAVEKAGTDNPLILLDEIDKLTNDRNGDPTSALLEALDPEQNNSFEDHFVGMPYDLSKVLFITTANYEARIPSPLRDRMEMIEIEGYIDSEKYIIAKKFLMPKVLKKNGLHRSEFKVNAAAIRKIIADYTKEAGLRELERQLEKAARRAAVMVAEEGVKVVSVTPKNLEEFLGPERYTDDLRRLKPAVGCCYGLAVTEMGGELLRIEVNSFPGKGKLELTGRLGDVMKESAKAAISFIRSRYKEFGLDPDFVDTTDLHIHVPFGSTPKEGPSAGITMATAIISELTGVPVANNVAMTGEISLHGDVLPIGGVKGKSSAAFRSGMKTMLLPLANMPQLDEVPDEVKNGLDIQPVSHMDQVIRLAFAEKPIKKKIVDKGTPEKASKASSKSPKTSTRGRSKTAPAAKLESGKKLDSGQEMT